MKLIQKPKHKKNVDNSRYKIAHLILESGSLNEIKLLTTALSEIN